MVNGPTQTDVARADDSPLLLSPRVRRFVRRPRYAPRVTGRIEHYESRGARWEDEFADDGDAEAARRGRRPPQVEVLLDDPAFVVVLKPSGVPTIPERFAKDKRTVVDEVAA